MGMTIFSCDERGQKMDDQMYCEPTLTGIEFD
jgi:hypothetical protein